MTFYGLLPSYGVSYVDDSGETICLSLIHILFAARSMELWLLEDMGFAVVAKFSVNAGEGEYVTEYRVYKGSDWADSEISLDLEDLVAELAALCDPYYEHEQPIYEL